MESLPEKKTRVNKNETQPKLLDRRSRSCCAVHDVHASAEVGVVRCWCWYNVSEIAASASSTTVWV